LPIRKVKTLLQKEFVKNVLTLMTGTVLGQGIALLLSPIITRLFALEDFSAFEQYSFLLSVLSVVICGKYEYSIMQPKEEEDARHLLALSLRIALFSSVIVLVLFFFTSGVIAEAYNSPSLRYLLWTLPFALFLAGAFNALNYWFSRQKNYRVAATSKFLYSAVGEPFKLIAGAIKPTPAGLILSTLIGHMTATWQSWWQFKKSHPIGLQQIDKTRMMSLAKTYNRYPRFAIWGSILNTLAQWAHVAVFGYYYGEAALIPIAYIALSRRIFFNPLGILANSYGQVFYQRIQQIDDGYQLKNFYISNLLRFAAFGAAMIGLVYLLPPNSLGFIFGEKWTEALVYLRVLCFWYALNFAITSLSFIFNRLQLQHYTLIADAVHFVSIVVAFACSFHFGLDALGAVKIMVLTKVIYLGLNLLAIIYFLNRNAKKSLI
jgi:O-antigen/teichoic acid export membrane protein